MTFNHITLVKKKSFIKQLNTKKGHYYQSEDGTIYPSITTIKDLTDPKDWFPYWIKKIMRDNDMNEEEANIEAKRIGESSMSVGTALHKLAEDYMCNIPLTKFDKKDFEIDPNELFTPLKKWLDEHVNNVFTTESKMYSKQLGLAGTVDWVAELDGVVTIGDFKNSRRSKMPSDIIRNKYYEQICAYGRMFEECYGIKVKQGVIVVVSWDGKVRPFKVNLQDYESKLCDMIIKYESEINV